MAIGSRQFSIRQLDAGTGLPQLPVVAFFILLWIWIWIGLGLVKRHLCALHQIACS